MLAMCAEADGDFGAKIKFDFPYYRIKRERKCLSEMEKKPNRFGAHTFSNSHTVSAAANSLPYSIVST